MRRSLPIAAGLLGFFGFWLNPSPAGAGTIYTSSASFFTAVSGESLLFWETFDGFATGSVGSPLAIGGGLASVSNASGIGTNGDDYGDVTGTSTTDHILGQTTAGTSLLSFSLPGGVSAFGLYFWPQHTSGSGTWTFGTTVSGGFTSAGCTLNPKCFVGWVGDPGETITSASYSLRGVRLDDVRAYTTPVPEPATLLLLGTGLAVAARRRLRKRA